MFLRALEKKGPISFEKKNKNIENIKIIGIYVSQHVSQTKTKEKKIRKIAIMCNFVFFGKDPPLYCACIIQNTHTHTYIEKNKANIDYIL